MRLEGEQLILANVGAVPIVLHHPLEGRPKTITPTRSHTDKWYTCFSCETEAKPLLPTDAVVGVEVGLSSFSTLSDEQTITNPRFYRRDEADLKWVQQRKDAARNAQDWSESAKQQGVLANIHERIASRRSDFAYKRSRELVDAYQVTVFEDLAPQEMGRIHGMRKSLLDVVWSQFIQITVVKAEEVGRQVILVNPKHTTKQYSFCGEIVPKALSMRVHTYLHCGLVLDGDENTAHNILHRGLQTLRL